jgi:hypothetical protein
MKQLDEKRIGLLIRMRFHRACVTSKKIIGPLLTRGFARAINSESYELTKNGIAASDEFAKSYAKKRIKTYRGLSIGNEVMIVDEK